MIEKIMKEKGITIITLVITIVVLLILASISLIALTGEHGLLQKTNKAEEKALIARYEEALENIGNRMKLKKAKKEVTNQDYMQKYKEEIENLLREYNSRHNVTLEDIIDFHYRFERIHPFGDENDALVQNTTYLHKYLQNKDFTNLGRSFILQ